MDKLYEGIYNATKNGLDIWGGKVPDNLISCLKDGDATGRKEYEDQAALCFQRALVNFLCFTGVCWVPFHRIACGAATGFNAGVWTDYADCRPL